jgi:hypothetical protein
MVQRAGDRPVPLTGLPEGLVAFPVQETRSDGIVVRTRRGREKLETVEIRARALAMNGASLDEIEEPFVLGAQRRRWSTIEAHYGGESWATTVGLLLRGAVTVRCRVDSASRLGAPISWVLTEAWDEERRRRAEVSTSAADEWQARAATASDAVSARCPELAAALSRARPGAATFPVLVHAAEDLATGISHAGPRAFSQTHFGHTKARDDAASVLRAAGIPESIVVTLGLRRSDRLGVAGPIVALVDGRTVALALLDGPVLIRADQRGLRLALGAECPLVVIENLQAAEIVADRFPDVALVYTAGLLGPAAIDLIAGLAQQAERALIAVDADAGGVRIAEQLLRVLPGALVLDAGAHPHVPRERWARDGIAVTTLQRALDGPAASLAASCLERGYPVEQETTIVESVTLGLGC